MTPPSRSVAPDVDGTRFRWRFGEWSFEVDRALGARITAFRLGADDILTGAEVNALNHGATFWTSPQSDWGWPPPIEIDSAPYEARFMDGDKTVVRFEGRPAPALGIAVAKTVSVDSERAVVSITYTLANHAGANRKVAPWEISRHPAGGLTFFPVDAADPPDGDPVDPRSNLVVRRDADAIWFAYDAASIIGDQKLFARGHLAQGWIAHVDVPRRLHLVKTFPPIGVADAAPGEGPIEIYADPRHTYVEVEQQGAYRVLAPGRSLDWTVTWRLRRLPGSIALVAANPELMAASRALAAL